MHVVSAMPWLRVVCWAGLVEDSAARAFAGGEPRHAPPLFPLQPHATPCDVEAGCNPMRWRLRPRVRKAAIPREQGCNPICARLQPHALTGLNDALGTFLAARKPLSSDLFELAYWAGIERFTQRGFRFGDPRRYLHPPGHPHLAAPEVRS